MIIDAVFELPAAAYAFDVMILGGMNHCTIPISPSLCTDCYASPAG